MATLKYVEGDVTEPNDFGVIVLPHIVNDIGAWGRGVVLSISKKWSNPEEKYRHWYNSKSSFYDKKPFQPGNCEIVPTDNKETILRTKIDSSNYPHKRIYVANMIAQNGIKSSTNPKPINYKALEQAMEQVVYDCSTFFNGRVTLHCPKFGAGLAGGDWSIIEQMIIKLWVEKDLQTTVYNF